jgi:cell cycle arrest protein BUB2
MNGAVEKTSLSNLEKFVYDNQSTLILSNGLKQLKYFLLTNKTALSPEFRTKLWVILLQIETNNMTSNYVNDLKQMKNDTDSLMETINDDENMDIELISWFKKINLDINRTLKNTSFSKDPNKLESLKRILYLFAYKHGYYIQGMNVLLAPILITCDVEPLSYLIFETLMIDRLSSYFKESLSLDNIHKGCRLVEVVLKYIDPSLYSKLNKKLNYPLQYIVMPFVMTLSASAEPIEEVIKIWDYMLAYGCHMNILFTVAQLVMWRDHIFKLNSEEEIINFMNNPPKIENGMHVVRLGIGLIDKLDTSVLSEILDHMSA